MPTLRQQTPRVKHSRGWLHGRVVVMIAVAVVAVASILVVGLMLWGVRAPLVVISTVVNNFFGPPQ